MKILTVHNRYRSESASGENTVVEEETNLLRSGGHTVLSYVAESDQIAGFSIRKKAALPLRVVWSREDHARLRALIRSAAPDVIHIHNTFPLISPSAIHASNDEAVPVVATLHNFRLVCSNGLLFREDAPCELCVGKGPWRGFLHACYRDSRAATLPIALGITTHRALGTWTRGVSRYFVLTSFAKSRFVANGLPTQRIVVKPNSVRRPERPRSGAGTHALFLGRLSPEKGVRLFLAACSRTSIPVVIAGDGVDRTVLEAKAGLLGDKVSFVGHRSREECSELLRGARMLVVPSLLYEGFPAVVAEAYAHGVPVVAPAHGGFPEIVIDGETGALFRPGNATSLADAIERLSDPTLSSTMGLAARSRYEDLYSPERNLATLLRVYGEAISERSKKAPPLPSGRR